MKWKVEAEPTEIKGVEDKKLKTVTAYEYLGNLITDNDKVVLKVTVTAKKQPTSIVPLVEQSFVRGDGG